MELTWPTLKSAIQRNFVIVIGIIVFLVIVGISAYQTLQAPPSTTQADTQATENLLKDTYIVQSGDYLWKIAENIFGSGYNAYDIAQANDIQEPYYVYKDQELIIPSVAPKFPTAGEILATSTPSITEENQEMEEQLIAEESMEKQRTESTESEDQSYTIKRGDSLWSIAVEVYGNGYGWIEIARANNLMHNPDLIHADNVLVIPPYEAVQS